MQYGTERTVEHASPEVPTNLLQQIAHCGITLLPLSQRVTAEELRARFPAGPVYACDFYIDGIERGLELPYGFLLNGITNIDHHASVPSMARRISSGNLAIEFVKLQGPLAPETPLVVNHLDCDSFVSALIMKGVLPPSPFWGEIVIAADHTGATEPFADLLQALADFRDLNLSAESLLRLATDGLLSPQASEALERRYSQRAELEVLIERGGLHRCGGVTWLESKSDLDGELLVPLVQDAALLMVATPSRDEPRRWINRIRLGQAAPKHLSLLNIPLSEMDPAWGGRWNAGSNNRGGGCALHPRAYAQKLAEKLERQLTK